MKALLILFTSLSLAHVAIAQEIRVVPADSQTPVEASVENFTGAAYIEWRFSADAPGRAGGGLVSFEPGARTNWHTHPLGQTLIVTEGVGRVQMWGDAIQEIKKGDIVTIPPNVKHWHGASPESAMQHIAVGEQLDGESVTWMEKVSNADFNAPLPRASVSRSDPGPSRAQQLMGEIAPKLAELTDDVLYADVWERPELSKRDRSLATVSALIAMNRPDQLRSHLAIARQNGVTEEELGEVITHLAFYAGWPSSVTAAVLAQEVFQTDESSR